MFDFFFKTFGCIKQLFYIQRVQEIVYFYLRK